MDILTILIMLFAGISAGIITGLIGASAVLVMAPLMIVLLDMNAYTAIGLSLATDIIASMVAAKVYYKNKNINLNAIVPLMFFSFIGIVIGSYASLSFPSSGLGGITGIAILILGIVFITKNDNKKIKLEFLEKLNRDKNNRLILLSLIGLFIGLISGIFGVGGGMMILAVLVFLLKFPLHKAIGTSIAMMVLMAFFGAVSHFYYDPFSIIFFLIAGVGAFFGAKYSSIIANKISERKLKKVVGVILVIMGFLLTIKILFF